MSEQLYRIVGKDEIKQEGDLVFDNSIQEWRTTDLANTHGQRFSAYIRPVDPVPVNPWIKGSDKLPTGEDVDSFGRVIYWSDESEEATTCKASEVELSDWWRPIDQTPPPAEPTEAELVEKLLTIVESQLKNSSYAAVNEAMEVAADIRKLQESEGRVV